jgi:hypothetical protein
MYTVTAQRGSRSAPTQKMEGSSREKKKKRRKDIAYHEVIRYDSGKGEIPSAMLLEETQKRNQTTQCKTAITMNITNQRPHQR